MVKKKALIIWGASGSGKSTKAEELVKEGWFEVNRDNIRFGILDKGGDWSTWQGYTKGGRWLEVVVSRIWGTLLNSLARENKNIVISDTNINKKVREELITNLESLGYMVEVEKLDVSVEECIKRDKGRGKFSVGENVIKDQFFRMSNA